MRRLAPFLLPAAAALVARPDGAHGRPEFAKREGKACGYCHINPRGGGPRNETGLLYARSNFSFPEKAADLRDLAKESDRDAIRRTRLLLDVQHIPAAIQHLQRVAKAIRGDAGKKLVADELHRLDVKGTEILGQGRLLLRSSKPKEADEGVELVMLVATQWKGLSVNAEALADLRDLRADPARKEAVVREEREAKARLLFLDGAVAVAEGNREKAMGVFLQVVERFPGTRAAEEATKRIATADEPK